MYSEKNEQYLEYNFIVLDDDTIFRNNTAFEKKHISTTWENGISYQNFCDAVRLLGKKDSKPIDIKTEESMF